LNSDHSSVLLNISATPLTRTEAPKLFSPLTNRLQFQNIINAQVDLNVKLKSNSDVDEAVNNLTTLIQSAAWAATKLVKPFNTYPNSHQIPEQIRSLIVEKRRARARYQSSRLPSHKSVYNKLANSFKKFLAKYKTNAFEQKLQSLSTTDGSHWKETKRMLK